MKRTVDLDEKSLEVLREHRTRYHLTYSETINQALRTVVLTNRGRDVTSKCRHCDYVWRPRKKTQNCPNCHKKFREVAVAPVARPIAPAPVEAQEAVSAPGKKCPDCWEAYAGDNCPSCNPVLESEAEAETAPEPESVRSWDDRF